MKEEQKIFCKRCKQRIHMSKKVMGFPIKKGMEFYEFEEGYYCGKCGKAEVEEAREKKK